MPKPNVDTSLVETLAEMLIRTGLTEIEISEGDARIRVARQTQTVMAEIPSAQRPAVAAAPPPPPEPSPATTATESHPGAIYAPMVGTVYLTPETGATPFVSVGDEVHDGQTLLIIEAMKVMNPIRATRSGRLVRLAVGSGDPVEYGELLVVIE